MAEKEYIERGALLKEDFTGSWNDITDQQIFEHIIELAPAADVVEVRHGKWKNVYQNKITTVYECSNCQHLSFGTSEYCICGAKMDGKRKEQK